MNLKSLVFAGVALAAATLAAQSSQDTVSLVLSGANGRQPRLAIPDFIVSGTDPELKAAARTVADVLWQDLEFEEEFYMIPADIARAVPAATSAATLPLAEWSQRGADFVLVATANRSAANLTIDIHVISVGAPQQGKDVLPLSYPCQMAFLRTCAHSMADSIHKSLRRYDGVAMSRMAFSSDRSGESASNVLKRNSKEIYIADYDGANVSPVTNNRDLNIAPTWSPDGKLLAYVSYVGGRVDIYVKSIYEARAAWRPAGGPPTAENQGPAFSPDGSQIAFFSNRDGTYQIYVVATDGQSPARRLTNTRAYEQFPSWSPSGSQLAFMSDRAGSQPLLYIMNADGTGQDALQCGAGCARPSWSPLGNEIAYTCGTNAPFNICTVNILTSKMQKLLADDGPSNEQPVFAPNGKHIAFATMRYGGKSQIAIMDLKGKIQRQVTNSGNNTWPSWSRSK